MPRIRSCTPDKSSTAAINDAQPAGGAKNNASVITTKLPAAPMRLSAKPVNVLSRNGMTEKFTNMLSQRRNRRRSV